MYLPCKKLFVKAILGFSIFLLIFNGQCQRFNNITDSPELMLKSVDSINVEVYYEEDAKPYTDYTFKDLPLWEILETNIKALFDTKEPAVTVSVPKKLEEMTQISSLKKETFTEKEILALAKELRKKSSDENSMSIFIIFLNGKYKTEDGVLENTAGLGFAFDNVIAVFKSKDKQSPLDLLDPLNAFKEQIILVHEIGHVFGLVNLAVPTVNDHSDPKHERHCINKECVMYYEIESYEALVKLSKAFYDKGDPILFDEDCLQDMRNFLSPSI